MEKEQKNTAVREDVVCGINPVREALRSGREIESLLVASGKDNEKIARILSECNSLRKSGTSGGGLKSFLGGILFHRGGA